MLEFKLLTLVILANGAPVLAYDVMKGWLAWPVDLGLRFVDRRPLFGPAKTWRGIFASLVVTSLGAHLLGFSWTIGLQIAAVAMAGDLLASFIKRRLNIESSGRALGLDQVPESLLPLLLIKHDLGLSWSTIGQLVAAFFLLEVTLSPMLYHLGLRKRPY
ncbi:MAG: CDP-archaeol synthase [Methylohalobius sp.]|nr:CDP-archaeol synthase [Methylohalobius sp.]